MWRLIVTIPDLFPISFFDSRYLLPCCCIHDYLSLICNMTMFWKKWIWTIWHHPQRQEEMGVCRQNICYHVDTFVISFNLICNMTMFWKKKTGPHPISTPRGWDQGLWSNVTFDLYNIYCTFVCMRNFRKNIGNWLSYGDI